MRWRPFQNVLIVAALCGLFSQGAFAQMPGTFSPLVATAGGAAGILDCIGGTVTYSGGNTIHTFTTAGPNDFSCPTARTVNYLLVAGGGGGGGTSYSGGGGAGGMLTGTASVPAATSTISVGAGGLAGAAGQRGSSGGNSTIGTPGGAGSFTTLIPTQTVAVLGSGFNNSSPRTRYLAALYSGTAPATGTQIRITIQGGASANVLNAMWCGQPAAASPSLNYDGNQVQIKFSGNGAITLPTGTIVSDAANFSFDKSKDFICSLDWNSTSVVGSSSAGANILGTYVAAPNASSTTISGTGTAANTYIGLTQVEVLTNITTVASATGGGGGGSYSTFVQGGSGGSSGGGSYGSTSAVAGTAGQGTAGGFYATGGSGGGGAGAAGANGTSTQAGIGGIGLASTISGASVVYAAGGSGGSYSGQAAGASASGIGGSGGAYSAGTCTAGVANTGSGGGGVSSSGTACNGGSGVAVISYPTGVPNVNCIGGTITTVGANTVHTFTTPGAAQINCVTGKAINYLIVAGGGGGGQGQNNNGGGGGGGAGGVLQGTAAYLGPGASTVTVGAGGLGGSTTSGVAGSGSGSIVFGIATTLGGGGGANNSNQVGATGGSGGGSSSNAAASVGTAGQGFAGGAGMVGAQYAGGGGGGAGGAGAAGTATVGGSGGVGITSSITGSSVCYAGGGGGAMGGTSAGTGGAATCGGGAGSASVAGTAGTPNTGGGGGASTVLTPTPGAAGGSGIVVASYVTGSTQAPPPGTWKPLISTQAPPNLGAGFSGYHLRTRYNTSAYIAGVANSGNTKFRVTVTGGGSTTNSFAGMWCGAAVAADPSMDFDGSQVQVTFSGANNLNLPSGTVVSDQMTYPFDKTKAFICSWNWSASTVVYGTTTGAAGINMGTAAGAGASAPNSVAGFNVTNASYNSVMTLIEVFGP